MTFSTITAAPLHIDTAYTAKANPHSSHTNFTSASGPEGRADMASDAAANGYRNAAYYVNW